MHNIQQNTPHQKSNQPESEIVLNTLKIYDQQPTFVDQQLVSAQKWTGLIQWLGFSLRSTEFSGQTVTRTERNADREAFGSVHCSKQWENFPVTETSLGLVVEKRGRVRTAKWSFLNEGDRHQSARIPREGGRTNSKNRRSTDQSEALDVEIRSFKLASELLRSAILNASVAMFLCAPIRYRPKLYTRNKQIIIIVTCNLKWFKTVVLNLWAAAKPDQEMKPCATLKYQWQKRS